jgi:ribonuclease HI
MTATPSPTPIHIYTDGACSGNPGPGGWAAILIDNGREIELSGGEPLTTNNRMELMGPIEGLRSLEGRRAAEIFSDSAYVVNCFRDKWYVRWRQNGWRNAQKKPVENRDLWEALLAEVERHDVVWHKVAGHSGHEMNDRADALARAAIPKR